MLLPAFQEPVYLPSLSGSMRPELTRCPLVPAKGLLIRVKRITLPRCGIYMVKYGNGPAQPMQLIRDLNLALVQ